MLLDNGLTRVSSRNSSWGPGGGGGGEVELFGGKLPLRSPPLDETLLTCMRYTH